MRTKMAGNRFCPDPPGNVFAECYLTYVGAVTDRPGPQGG